MILNPFHYLIGLYIRFRHEFNNHEGVEYLRYIDQPKNLHTWSSKLYKGASCNVSSCCTDLPSFRLKGKVRPFSSTGMDFFGALEIKVGKRSEKKGVVYSHVW